MANFLLLYTGGSMPESPAEQEAVMQAWGVWFGKIGSNLVDGGNPFTPKAKSISSTGTVSNGPVGELATGYTVIKANSLDAAVAAARECPFSAGRIQNHSLRNLPSDVSITSC